MRRTLKPTGIACIIFAHKSTEAWETIINALLNSGLYLTASWPVHTEMKAHLRASESAALASSIYMVYRKRTENKTAYFNEIKPCERFLTAPMRRPSPVGAFLAILTLPFYLEFL